MIFEELERFVTAHRRCDDLTSDVDEVTEAGYLVPRAAHVLPRSHVRAVGHTFGRRRGPAALASTGVPQLAIDSRCQPARPAERAHRADPRASSP